MKHWVAVFLSLLIAVIAALSSPSIVERLSIGNVSFLDIVDPVRVGTSFVALLLGSVVYGVVATVVLTFAMILDILSARDTLGVSPSSGHYLLRRDWEAAFKSEILKPARHRIVTQLAQTGGEHLLLAEPFSPRRARSELRAIYVRQLAVAQVWTVIGGLLLSGSIVALLSAEATAMAMIRPILLGVVIVIASVGIAWLAVCIVIDTFTSVLAEAPFFLKSPMEVPSHSQAEIAANDEQVASTLAPHLRSQIETVALQLSGLCSTTLDQTITARLPDITAGAISTVFKQCLEDARPTIARMAEATDALGIELPARVAEASASALQRVSTDQIEAIHVASAAVIVEQKAMAEKLDDLLRAITGGSGLQLEVARQLATELSQLGPALHAWLGEASADAARERDAASTRASELRGSIEAYAGSLLPAIKRLESYDERVLRAMNQESDTLAQLAISVSELSGTLEVLRVRLGHAPLQITAAAEEHAGRQPAPRQIEHAIQGGPGNMAGLASELRSLLDDLDE